MLGNLEYGIPDVDPFFRDKEEIALAKRFQEDNGQEFSYLIGKAMQLLADSRPHDPVVPFVKAFGPTPSSDELCSKGDGASRISLEESVENVQILPAVDWAGTMGMCVVIHIFNKARFVFPASFTQVLDGSSTQDVSAAETAWRKNVIGKSEAFVREWYVSVILRGEPFSLKNYLFVDHALTELLARKTEISENTQSAAAGKAGKKSHSDKKAVSKPPATPVKNVVQRIKYSALDDGFVAVSCVSLGMLALVSQELRLPVSAFIRIVAENILPGSRWPSAVPMPFVSMVTLPKNPEGKLRIIHEVMVCPKGLWEPEEFFHKAQGAVRNFQEKMCTLRARDVFCVSTQPREQDPKFALQGPAHGIGNLTPGVPETLGVVFFAAFGGLPRTSWNTSDDWTRESTTIFSRGTMFWGMDKVAEAFAPLRVLLSEEHLDNYGTVVSLNTAETQKGLYDVKGKPKGVESVLKILSALFGRDRGLLAVFNPVNVEHAESLIPFCKRWADRHRRPLLFHEQFAAFNKILGSFPVWLRGALITLQPEDTVRSLITRISAAHGLGVPVCLQNRTGLAFEDATLFLEIGIGLGVEFVKVDAPACPQFLAVAKRYREIAKKSNDREDTPTTWDSGPSSRNLEPVFCPHALDSIVPGKYLRPETSEKALPGTQ